MAIAMLAPDAFSLAPPSITPGQTATANVGTNLTLSGVGFGAKKGKVIVGAKKATVVTWTDTAITFVVPKTIPNGAVVVDVTTGGGTDSISAYLTVTGSSVPLAKNKVTGAVGGKLFRPRIHYIFFTGNDWTLQMKTLGKRARVLSLALFNLTSIPAIYDGTETSPATLTLTIGPKSYSGNPGQFKITITHREANKFGGVISGTVTGTDGTTIAIQSVQFIYDTGL